MIQRLGEDMDDLTDIAEQVLASGKLYKVGVDPAGVGGIMLRPSCAVTAA